MSLTEAAQKLQIATVDWVRSVTARRNFSVHATHGGDAWPPPPVALPDGDAGPLICHHRYQLAAEAPSPAPGQVVARFAAMALRRPVTVEKVWYDLRTSGEQWPSGQFGAGALGRSSPSIARPVLRRRRCWSRSKF